MESTPSTMKELIKIERAFLHDLATPLMIAGGSLESVTDNLSGCDPKVLDRIAKTQTAIEKMTELLRNHRKQIVAIDKATD